MRNKILIFLLFGLFFSHFLSAQEKAELVVQIGHYETINAIVFSPDGKWLASAGKDKNVIIWDIASGKEFRRLIGHTGEVSSLAFSPDGKILVSGGGGRDDAQLIFWNWSDGKILHQISKAHSNEISYLAFDKKGERLVSGTYQNLKIWNTQNYQPIFILDERNVGFNEKSIKHEVRSIVFSPDNQTFITGTAQQDLQIWTSSGKLLKNIDLIGSKSRAEIIAFKPDGKSFYHSGSMGKVVLRETSSGKILQEMDGFGSGSPCPSAFSPDLKLVITACADAIKVQSLQSGELLYEINQQFSSHTALTYNPQNSILAAAGNDRKEKNSIQLFNAQTGNLIRTLEGHPGKITSVAFSSDNHKIASGSSQRPARVWDLNSINGFKNYLEGVLTERGDIFSTVAFSPDNQTIYNGIQGRLFSWDVESSQLKLSILEGSREKRNLKIDPFGKKIIHLKGTHATIWNAENGEEIKDLGAANLMTRSIALSPNAKIIYAGGWQEIKRWDAQTYQELSPFKIPAYAWEITVSPDNQTLAIDGNELYLLNAQNGEFIKKLNSSQESELVFSPDGKYLASAWGDTILIRETTQYQVVRKLMGHYDLVSTLHFSPDQKYLLSGSDDCTLKLWNWQKGELVATFLALDEEDFIITTPDLYYMTTKDGTKGVAFRLGNRILPFESFDMQYNRPDIILERIGYAPPELIDALKKAYQKRLRRLNFDEKRFNKDFHLPQVKLLNNNLSFSTPEKTFNLHIKAEDAKYFLDRLHLSINDNPVFGLNGLDLSKKNQHLFEQKFNLELSNGLNKIQFSVMNEKGVESITETFTVHYIGVPSPTNTYIISIGVSKYKNPRMNLRYARKDAEDLLKTFQSTNASQVEANGKIYVQALFDEQVTNDNLLKIKELTKKTKVDDKVILFFAGHGLLADNLDYYLATYDIDFRKPEKNGLIYEKLESLLDAIPARNKVLMIDACHSGEVDKEEELESLPVANNSRDGQIKTRDFDIKKETKTEKETSPTENADLDFDINGTVGLQNSFDLMKNLFADLRKGTGATVISSAGGREYALEGDDWNNGVFTYALLSGLKKKSADANQDGKISLSEIKNYVQKIVPELTGGRQQPTSRIENLSNDFRVW